MVGHGEIADPDPHLVVLGDDERIDARETPGCSRSRVEVGHRHDTLGTIGAGIDVVGREQEGEVPVDAAWKAGSLGWTTKKPIMPIAICTISSECGWYMKVPRFTRSNS
jgi:hypothetical protein